MPGRGQYWKKGGLVDETVKEEDLSQALQTKVNTGGGGSLSQFFNALIVCWHVSSRSFSYFNASSKISIGCFLLIIFSPSS